MRTGPYIAQRVSNAIAWIHTQMEYNIFNYVDDFLGVENENIICASFTAFISLLKNLNIHTSPGKIVEPTPKIEFLGTFFDAINMKIEVPKEKLEEIKGILKTWLLKTSATRRELESIIGKLQFAARAVRPGRIFVSRLLNWLRTLGQNRSTKYFIPVEARRDIAWWGRYMEHFNGTAIMWLHTDPVQQKKFTTDASLEGYGGITGCHYFRGKFPKHFKNQYQIVHLEMWAVLVAVKLWGCMFAGTYFWVETDNQAIMSVLNTGASRDVFLQNALRELTMHAAIHQFVIKAKYINTKNNVITDSLSRWGKSKSKRIFRKFAQDKSLIRHRINSSILTFQYEW